MLFALMPHYGEFEMTVSIRTIDDKRIGVREITDKGEYRISQTPTRYPNGAFYSQSTAEATPTTVYFGHKGQFFYYVPAGHARISDELSEELLAIVDAAVAPYLEENKTQEESTSETKRGGKTTKQVDAEQTESKES